MKPKYTYDRTSLITNFIKMAKCILADGGKNEQTKIEVKERNQLKGNWLLQ